MYVCVMYMSCSACAKTLLSFCVYEQRLCHVFAVYVIATYVNRSENRNRLIYCVAQMCICVKVELCLRNVYVMYMSCSTCAKTLLSFCIYEQRLYCIFAMYVIATHVNRSENRNWLIYCVAQMCICAKTESCLRNVCVCDVYKFQHVCKDVAVVLCIWAKTVSCFCSVCDCNACKSI